MPVLSAVLTLDEQRREQTLVELAADPRITLGDPTGPRLPVVLETSTRVEDKDLWRFVERHPGVVFTELAFADFSDLVLEQS